MDFFVLSSLAANRVYDSQGNNADRHSQCKNEGQQDRGGFGNGHGFRNKRMNGGGGSYLAFSAGPGHNGTKEGGIHACADLIGGVADEIGARDPDQSSAVCLLGNGTYTEYGGFRTLGFLG